MFKCIHLKAVCYHIVFFVLIATTKENVEARRLNSPAVELSGRTVGHPIVHHGRAKREIRDFTRDETGAPLRYQTVTISFSGKKYVLDMSLNEKLVAKDYVIRYKKNGETVMHKPTKQELDICQYSGTVRDKPGSWAALSVCRGVSGVFDDGSSVVYIEPNGETKVYILEFTYQVSDLNTTNYRNGIDDTNKMEHTNERSMDMDSTSDYKGEVSSSNDQSRYVELVLVADNEMFKANKESVDNVNQKLMHYTNILNSVFALLNVSIVLMGVEIWNERDEIRMHGNGRQTLFNFLDYRRTTLLPSIPNDSAFLLTHQVQKGDTVGRSFLAQICTTDKSGGTIFHYTNFSGLIANSIASQLGSSLGMIEDTEDCLCPKRECIMENYNTVEKRGARWSSCSSTALSIVYDLGIDYCLKNKPVSIFE